MQKNSQTHLMSQCCLHVYGGKNISWTKMAKFMNSIIYVISYSFSYCISHK